MQRSTKVEKFKILCYNYQITDINDLDIFYNPLADNCFYTHKEKAFHEQKKLQNRK